MASAHPRPELLVIAGPTASGKSALALRVAKQFNGEIISADSWTVYKGFDIGTSKSTITQQKAVKHHLIDVREPNDGFSAPMFKEMADKAIKTISQRGKLPILAGGTGLYIDSVVYDYGFLPNLAPDERGELDVLMLDELLKLAASRQTDLTDIDIRNKRRVIRAIEAGGQKPTKTDLRPNTLYIGLQPDPEILKQQIEKRVDIMLAAGLEQEVRQLSNRYSWGIEPMKGIGYQQWKDYFAGDRSLEETRARIISATNQLAKRQRTWFKRNPDIQWFSSAEEAYAFLAGVLNT